MGNLVRFKTSATFLSVLTNTKEINEFLMSFQANVSKMCEGEREF
jgi:hypothetical protein